MADDLPDRVRAYRPNQFVIAADDASEVVSLQELERRYIERVLKLVGDNKSRAAQILGVDRRTLYRKLERFEEEKKANGSIPRPTLPSTPAPAATSDSP
jgi:two-component system response regulator HydG